MKRVICIALALLLALGALACSGKTEQLATQATAVPASTATAAPADVSAPATAVPTESPAPEPELPYWVFEYPYGSLRLNVDKSMPEQPQDDGTSILFADPEGAWTARFTPLSVQQTEIRLNNLTNSTESKKTFGYYRNVVIEDRTGVYVGDDIRATWLAFERDPDWVESQQGYTAGATEPHAYLLLDYGDIIIGPWGGLEIDISLPKKSTDPLDTALSDNELVTLLEGIDLIEGAAEQTVSLPGLSVSFPARWTPATDGKQTIWSGISGATKGSIYFGTSIYADPQEAAEYLNTAAQNDYRMLTFGGREWYGAVRTSTLQNSTLKGLELFTSFTEFHALYMKLNLNGWTSDEDFWAYTETDTFQRIMESVETDPKAFHNPEDDRRDASGFEANNINELSGYTGTETELVIPAVVGTTEIVGINTNLFKNNTDITSIVLSEGIVYIEYGAFQGCKNLKKVVLPNSLTYIDYHAFEDCTALETVTFGNGLTVISNEAFENCTSLQDVILPDTVQTIDKEAFRNAGDGTGRFVCPASGTQYMGASLYEAKFREVVIGPNADLSQGSILCGFVGESVSIGDGCAAIGEYFLMDPYVQDTKLKRVDLPQTVKTIGRSAFSGRLGLSAIDLGTVETLGESAFYRTGLVDIHVPGTVETIPASCFSNCVDAMTITIDEGVTFADEWAFEGCGRTWYKRWQYDWFTPEEAKTHPEYVENGTAPFDHFLTITLPSTLQKTGYGAFCNVFANVYMLWVTEPGLFPAEFDPDTFAGAQIGQIFFTQEAIEAYGDELDAIVSGFEDVGERAWYDEGKQVYWTEYKE